MRIDTSKDFDLQIRSMLENAEERVPSGVWRGVCSSLDGAKPAIAGWKWAGAALAFAAAIAAGLFFTGTIDKAPAAPATELVAEEATKIYVEEPSGTTEPVVQESVAAAPARLVAKATPASRKPAAPAAVEASSLPEAAPIYVEPAAVPANTVEVVEAPAAAKTEKVEGQPTTDIFAQMILEDEMKAASSRRKVAVTLGGAMGANDKDFTGVFGPKRSASSVVFTGQNKLVESGSSTFGIPFSVGLGVRFPLGERFAIGTGVDYSLLTRKFTGVYYNESGVSSGEVSVDNKMHYIGVPLNLYIDIISLDRLKFYCYGGGEGEYCFKNIYNIHTGSGINQTSKVSGLQFSIGAGLGVEFLFTDVFGVYFDPGVRYYFANGQPKSLRTEHPFNINFDLGLRFDF